MSVCIFASVHQLYCRPADELFSELSVKAFFFHILVYKRPPWMKSFMLTQTHSENNCRNTHLILPFTVFNHSCYYFKRHKDQRFVKYFELCFMLMIWKSHYSYVLVGLFFWDNTIVTQTRCLVSMVIMEDTDGLAPTDCTEHAVILQLAYSTISYNCSLHHQWRDCCNGAVFTI